MAAAVIALLLRPHDALAQTRIDTDISSPARPADDRRRQRLIRTPLPVPERDPFSRPAPRVRPGPDAGADPDAPVDGERAAAGRRGQRDGDLAPLVQPQPQDGTIVVGEPAGPLDGGDPTLDDNRPAEDLAAFESPPAGYDPGAFSIELSPILDRRPRQLFRFQPYQQIGTKIGSFVLFSQLETGISATNNVFNAADTKHSDVAVDIAPSARLVSNWRVHAVEASATGLASFHREFSTEDDREYTIETRGRLDITKRSNIGALLSQNLTQESRGTVNSTSGIGGERTEIITRTAAVTVNHRFNRLALQLRGSLIDYDYGASEVDMATPPATSVFVMVDDRDYIARDVVLRASWEFNPQLTIFGEAAVNDRKYDMLQDGVRRDSVGDRWRLGVSFGNSGEIIRGEVSVGFARQRPEADELAVIEGIVIDANLAWRVNALTSVLLTARSDIDETTVTGAGGGLARAAGIGVRHAFRRNLIGTAGVDYAVTDYDGSDLSESTLTASLGAEFSLNRNVVLFGDYDHIRYDSTAANSGYDVDEVRIGVRLRK